MLRPGKAVARGDCVKCEVGCGGEGDGNVSACFAGTRLGCRLPKSSGAAGTAGTSGSVTPGRSDAKTSPRARSLPPAPAPGRSRWSPRVGELVGDAVRSREPTDGPVPALPSPPETHTQIIPCRNCYAFARCWIRLGNARARAPRASKRATRARGVPRVSRARDTIGNPGVDARWNPGGRVFASFGPRDEALTLPRVIRETARVFNSRRERAPCGSIERRTPGSSAWPARRTFGEASNARCTTGGRCVLCVVARLRVRRTIETESQSPFLPSGSALQVLFHGSKKVRAGVRAEARFSQTRCAPALRS